MVGVRPRGRVPEWYRPPYQKGASLGWIRGEDISRYVQRTGYDQMPYVGEKPNFKVLREVQLRLRRAKTAELVLKGWTRVRIAEFFGISTSAVRNDLDAVQTEWKETRVGCFDLFVQHQTECLDKDEWDLRGRILELDENSNLDPIKKLDAVVRVYGHILRVMERRSKMLGLDKPSEIRVTHMEVKQTIQSIIAVIVDEVQDPDQRERIGHKILALVAGESSILSQDTVTISSEELAEAS